MTNHFSFTAALTKDEAIQRIYRAIGATSRGTRGEKGALDALLLALGLELDVATTTRNMARVIARRLDLPWSGEFEDRNKVALAGLNALLAIIETSGPGEVPLSRVPNQDADLALDFHPTYLPAASKIEAVNRLSRLAGAGREDLGPGGKERKRVLVNAARRFAPHLDTNLSKSRLAAAIANDLGAPWDRSCASTGETIALRGLNALIAGAEAYLSRNGLSAEQRADPKSEGQALLSALFSGISSQTRSMGGRWDGKRSVEWMRRQGLRTEMNQSEWQGFLFEAVGRSILASTFSRLPNSARVRYGHTTFDYSHHFVWDLKVHTENWIDDTGAVVERGSSETILNDEAAIADCTEEQGLGFLILSGQALSDVDGRFKEWHRSFKLANGVRTRSSNSGQSRRLKAAFTPSRLDAFYFPHKESLSEAASRKMIAGFVQGRQAPSGVQLSGAPRAKKLKARLDRLRNSEFHVAEEIWPSI